MTARMTELPTIHRVLPFFAMIASSIGELPPLWPDGGEERAELEPLDQRPGGVPEKASRTNAISHHEIRNRIGSARKRFHLSALPVASFRLTYRCAGCNPPYFKKV